MLWENYRFLLFADQSHICFYGVCRYCKPELSVCGDGNDFLEAAVILWLPSKVKLKSNRSPWQRTYKRSVQAQWETDDNFCSTLQKQNQIFRISPIKRRLLDLVDASVFDFLISNGDRHHYEVIDGQSDAAVLLLDNGKRWNIFIMHSLPKKTNIVNDLNSFLFSISFLVLGDLTWTIWIS